jgi:hypothetical protein
MRQLTQRELDVIYKVLNSPALQNLIGAEEWDLTEEEEWVLWHTINTWTG